MKTLTPQVTASLPLRPGLTESNVCPALTGLYLDIVWPGRRWGGVGVGAASPLPASASFGTNVCGAAASVGACTLRIPRQGRSSCSPQPFAPPSLDPLRGAGAPG